MLPPVELPALTVAFVPGAASTIIVPRTGFVFALFPERLRFLSSAIPAPYVSFPC